MIRNILLGDTILILASSTFSLPSLLHSSLPVSANEPWELIGIDEEWRCMPTPPIPPSDQDDDGPRETAYNDPFTFRRVPSK